MGNHLLFYACFGHLVKILITIKPMGYLDQILHTYLFLYCPALGMNIKGGEGLPRIILGGRGILVKMPMALEPHGIF